MIDTLRRGQPLSIQVTVEGFPLTGATFKTLFKGVKTGHIVTIEHADHVLVSEGVYKINGDGDKSNEFKKCEKYVPVTEIQIGDAVNTWIRIDVAYTVEDSSFATPETE